MKQVIVFPRGQLKQEDITRLYAAGVVAVEADDPSKVVCPLPSSSIINADDFLMSALHAVTGGGEWRRFTEELFARLKKRDDKAAK